MLEEVLSRVEYYDWWLIGLVILIIEMLTGTLYLLWLGIAAGVVGVLLLLFPELNWKWQLVLYAVTSVLSLALWIRFDKRRNESSDKSKLGMNQRGAAYIGKRYPLVEDIVNGVGMVNIDDTLWSVRGPDSAKGQWVEVVSQDGNVLTVKVIIEEL